MSALDLLAMLLKCPPLRTLGKRRRQPAVAAFNSFVAVMGPLFTTVSNRLLWG